MCKVPEQLELPFWEGAVEDSFAKRDREWAEAVLMQSPETLDGLRARVLTSKR